MRLLASTMILSTLIGCAAPRASSPAGVRNIEFLTQYAETRRFSLGHPTAIKLAPDGSAAYFLRSGPRSVVQDLYEFDAATGQERILLTAESILKGGEEHLSVEESARRERMRMSSRGISSYALSKDGSRILVPLSGRLFVVHRADGRVTELAIGEGAPLDPRFSPDGRHVAFVRDGDLFVIDVPTDDAEPAVQPMRLTVGASATIAHGLSEFVAQEEMGRFEGYWWSPDSTTLAYQQTDTSGVEVLHIADPTHPERPAQDWPYPRPGKSNAKVRLGVIAATGGATTWVSWDQEKYPYLATVRWSENAPLTLLVQNREQTDEALLTADAATGTTSNLLVETDPAWLNLDQQMPRWLKDGSAFLWTTERGGAWQLEFRSQDGRLVRALTAPVLGYRGLSDLNEANRTVIVSGGADPTQTHLFSIKLDAEPDIDAASDPSVPRSLDPSVPPAQRLTHDPGSHGLGFSEDHRLALRTFQGLNGTRRQEILGADGQVIAALRSVAEEPPFLPNLELTTVGDSPCFHAAIIRPRDFKPGRRYPVIVSVYGGPHAQTVSASRRGYLLQQWMADHGFIVVSLDGRGTPARGREWERAIKGDLIEIPLADQAAGLQALGKKYPELDMARVGITGWSFGGYFSAMAVMRRPDVFHAGVAGAPVADWLDYDTHYTERYLGLPERNPEGYERSSVLTWAKDLSRPLLIIHGTADDNVYFTHSLKLSDALFRAGKAHEFMPLSGFTHMVPDALVTQRLQTRVIEFFQAHVRD